jgi:hypothetical protein
MRCVMVGDSRFVERARTRQEWGRRKKGDGRRRDRVEEEFGVRRGRMR